MSSEGPTSVFGKGFVSCGAVCAVSVERPCCIPMRMPLSVGCTITGRSLVGSPPIVGCTILPEPLRTVITKSAVCVSRTGVNRPHFISAFSTSSWAVLFARGEVAEIPASGSMSIKTVRALRTKAGSKFFFLLPAIASEVNTRTIKSRTRTRTNITASMRRTHVSIVVRDGEVGQALFHLSPKHLGQLLVLSETDDPYPRPHALNPAAIFPVPTTRGAPPTSAFPWVGLSAALTQILGKPLVRPVRP